jgi:hypothetical protein
MIYAYVPTPVYHSVTVYRLLFLCVCLVVLPPTYVFDICMLHVISCLSIIIFGCV